MQPNKPLNKKILLLGIDGMDPRFTRWMLDQGKMPNTQKMLDRGAARPDLVMLGGFPTITPPMWTTLATGTYPNVHGITGFSRASKAGLDYMEYNIDSRNCKAEQLWNVTAEAGYKTLVWHWPGSSWPPSSDSENLYVVDGTSPGSVNMSAGQVHGEFLFGANVDFKEVRVIPPEKSEAVTPCVVTDMELDEESDKKNTLFKHTGPKMQKVKTIIMDYMGGQGGATAVPMEKVISPLRPADTSKWANAPEGALEFTILLAQGLIRRPGLALKGENGQYDHVAIYKSKKDAEPLVSMTKGEMVFGIIDEDIKDDKHLTVNRNVKLLDIDPQGKTLSMWISASMDTKLDSLWSPKSLYKTISDNIGFPPPTSLLCNQEKNLLWTGYECWDGVLNWQADSLNYLMDNENFDIVFSHFHNIDLENHNIMRYLTDVPEQEGHPGPLWGKMTPAENHELQEAIYEQADRYIGRFLHYLDEGWTIFVFSDHAQVSPKHGYRLMGDHSGINVRLMQELGLTALKKDADGNDLPEIDWEHTYAVAQRECHIYLNIKGRDEHGIIDPKDQYEWEEEVITRLYGYKDPVTGKRIINLALRNRDAAVIGLGGSECGDIVYACAEGYNWDHGDSLATTYGEANTSVSPIFLAAGPGIKHCTTDRVIREVDLAPTVAVVAGVRMPAQCEGAPVYQILD
jgi:predicted AlkP superfamily phosphohydrolase/phosphomutase